MKFLGIDVGQNGAAAVIELVNGVDGAGAKLVDVIDIPTVGVGTKTRVDAIGLRDWITSHNPDLAGVRTRRIDAAAGRRFFISVWSSRRCD
jgi:hypothetical protein